MKPKQDESHPNVNVRFEANILKKIKALAKSNERSVAAQIRHMVAKVLSA